MKKLTKKNLKELANIMPEISEMSQRTFVGGGDGSMDDPYTEDEFNIFLMSGHFPGGYVLFGGDATPTDIDESYSCVGSGVIYTSYNPASLIKTGVGSYDSMYRAGYSLGYDAGRSGSNLDDVEALVWSGIVTAAAGSEFGDINYDMIWYGQGIRDGYQRGLEDK